MLRRDALTLLVPCLLPGATLPKIAPERAGVSAERLKRVTALLDRYIQKRQIAGVVSLVARKGAIVHLQAQGLADVESQKPLATDAIFRLASMTKPVTSVAAMMLHEEGHFLLDDPVSKFLPEFPERGQVAIPNAPNERATAGYRLIPAEGPVTIRQLLTHTAGLGNVAGFNQPENTMAEYCAALAKLPLKFHPGTHWEYGPATNVVGRLVEVVSGRSLDEFFRARIFGPLGMQDTCFYLPEEKLSRLVTAYGWEGDRLKKLTALGPAARNGRFFAGAGGLAGTAEDYLRFCQTLLNGGQLDGTRLLSRKSVEAMTANHIGKLPLWQDTYRGYGFGLGFRVRLDVGQSATLGSVGEYGWGGAYGTYFWNDPKEQMVGILMIQLMPYAHLNLRPQFQNAVTQAIVD